MQLNVAGASGFGLVAADGDGSYFKADLLPAQEGAAAFVSTQPGSVSVARSPVMVSTGCSPYARMCALI